MGEVVDINKEFTTDNLTIQQKISVIWNSLVSDSKILGKRKKDAEAKELKKLNETRDALRDGILASLTFHLRDNGTLAEMNLEAEVVQLAIDRKYAKLIPDIISNHSFNVYDIEYIELDPDIVNSFGDSIPIVIAFKQKEVTT